MIVHWNDVEGERAEQGHLAGTRFDLGTAAGTRNVGVTRIRVDPGRWSTPAHVELDEEEIYYVLDGSGRLWQGGNTYEIGAGDCVVERVAEEAHTFRAGDEGLDVLAFGERTNPTATHLPRAQVVRMRVTLDVSQGPHPWNGRRPPASRSSRRRARARRTSRASTPCRRRRAARTRTSATSPARRGAG